MNILNYFKDLLEIYIHSDEASISQKHLHKLLLWTGLQNV